MDVIQSYYTFSNKNNGAKLKFLLNIGLSCLINNHGYKTKGGHALNSRLTALL